MGSRRARRPVVRFRLCEPYRCPGCQAMVALRPCPACCARAARLAGDVKLPPERPDGDDCPLVEIPPRPMPLPGPV